MGMAIIAIIFWAFLLRVIGIWPNIQYADEAHIQVYSWDLLKNIITQGDFNPHSLKYGSLIFYLHALFSAPVFLFNFIFHGQGLPFGEFYREAVRLYATPLTIAGRISVAILGTLSVYFIFLIGQKLFDKRVGLLAALFLATAPMHVRESHYMITDVIFIFTILLSVLFLILMWQKKSFKWFMLAGLAVGLSSTVRYLPLVFLIYPLALIFTFQNIKIWFLKIAASLGGFLAGIFMGVPFLFLDPQGPYLLAKDLETYALPWYGSGWTISLIYSILSFLAQTKITVPHIELLYPASAGFRPLFLSWLFFNGIGPTVFILSLAGIVSAFFISRKIALFLLTIPLVLFIYISFFIPAIYEKLSLPIIPFLALFAALPLRKLPSKLFLGLIIFLLVVPQFIKSFSASLSCGQDSIQSLSQKWVDENIPLDAKIGFTTPVSVPSTKEYAKYLDLSPQKNLSLEEARNLGLDYVFLNGERLDRETYPIFNDYFIVPHEIYENTFEFLSLKEYLTRARLLQKIQKPIMCDPTRIYYFKLPPPLPKQEKILKTGEQLTQETMPIEAGKIYTFSFMASSQNNALVFARMDFTGDKKQGINPLLLLWEGSTPIYFEKNMDTKNIVALSPRTKLTDTSGEISITAKAPPNAKTLTLSIYRKGADIKIQDIKLLGQ